MERNLDDMLEVISSNLLVINNNNNNIHDKTKANQNSIKDRNSYYSLYLYSNFNNLRIMLVYF